jgi:hypothetical protein
MCCSATAISLCPDEAEEAQVSSQLLTDPTGRIVAALIVLAVAT